MEQQDTKKRFWEGACGIILEPKKNRDGSYFWTYRFTRVYSPVDSEDRRYSDTFTERNDEAIATLMSRAIQFREQNDAAQWLSSQMPSESTPRVR